MCGAQGEKRSTGVSKSSVHGVSATSPMLVRADCADDRASAGHRETVHTQEVSRRVMRLRVF